LRYGLKKTTGRHFLQFSKISCNFHAQFAISWRLESRSTGWASTISHSWRTGSHCQPEFLISYFSRSVKTTRICPSEKLLSLLSRLYHGYSWWFS
jgi:hypothetical protein